MSTASVMTALSGWAAPAVVLALAVVVFGGGLALPPLVDRRIHREATVGRRGRLLAVAIVALAVIPVAVVLAGGL